MTRRRIANCGCGPSCSCSACQARWHGGREQNPLSLDLSLRFGREAFDLRPDTVVEVRTPDGRTQVKQLDDLTATLPPAEAERVIDALENGRVYRDDSLAVRPVSNPMAVHTDPAKWAYRMRTLNDWELEQEMKASDPVRVEAAKLELRRRHRKRLYEANPSAVQADAQPVKSWTIGGPDYGSDVALCDGPFDGTAARKSIWAWATNKDSSVRQDRAKRCFLLVERGREHLKGAYKIPLCVIVRNRPVYVGNAVRNALSRLPQTYGVPPQVEARARAVAEDLLTAVHSAETCGW